MQTTCRHVEEEEEVDQAKSSCGWSTFGGDNPGRRLDPCSHWPMAQHSTSTSPNPANALPNRACKPTLINFSTLLSLSPFHTLSTFHFHLRYPFRYRPLGVYNRPHPIELRSHPTRTYLSRYHRHARIRSSRQILRTRCVLSGVCHHICHPITGHKQGLARSALATIPVRTIGNMLFSLCLLATGGLSCNNPSSWP